MHGMKDKKRGFHHLPVTSYLKGQNVCHHPIYEPHQRVQLE